MVFSETADELSTIVPMFVLEVVSGPLDGKTWRFEREITIGRDDTVADACLALDRYVSRCHARLVANGEKLRLTDLKSRNGVKVAGQSVNGDATVAIGIPFTIGRTMLRVTRA